MTNAQLKRTYKRFNRKYFRGKLPDLSVRFEEMVSNDILGITCFFGQEPAGIEISKRIKHWSRLSKQVLLHECVHVSLPRRVMHGPKFEARMRHLARQKAFSGLW